MIFMFIPPDGNRKLSFVVDWAVVEPAVEAVAVAVEAVAVAVEAVEPPPQPVYF